MYVMSIEKRISAEAGATGTKQEEDWWALFALTSPFVPTVGLKILLAKEKEIIELTRVLWIAETGIFWTLIKPHLHPRPDAETVARSLVDNSFWTVACGASELDDARQCLVKKTITKLHSAIVQGSMTPAMLKQLTNLKGGGKLQL